MLVMNAVLPGMWERKAGRILNICSAAGRVSTPHISAYGVGKCAEIKLTEHVDNESKVHQVRAFAIHPGRIITDMFREMKRSPEARRWTRPLIDQFATISTPASAKALRRCTMLATKIAAGDYDILAGRYLDFADDLDVLVRAARRRPRR
jgi:NAD(P)-dependent dehydrogenase (short-subunit alcohol dehydrogenase family)